MLWIAGLLSACATGQRPPPALAAVEAPDAVEAPAASVPEAAPAVPAVPAELVGSEATPRLDPGCTFVLEDHDADEQPFHWEVALSQPDDEGRRWVQRVTLWPAPRFGLPAPSPVAAIYVLDAYQHFHHAARSDAEGAAWRTYVSPRAADFREYPLRFRFIAPRPDRPRQIGEYELRIAVDPGSRDGTKGVERPFEGCSNYTSGPGNVGACTIVEGTCRDVYAALHPR